MRSPVPCCLALALAVACGGEVPTLPPPDSAADSLLAVSAWLSTASSPVPTAAPATGDGELTAVRAAVAGARVIGLGEATHGTHEFQVMKHRVLQTLAREGGVAAFLLETDLAEARALDRYVRDGTGDPVVLLSHLYGTAWNTQELLDMIRWLRAFNATRPPETRVGFAGVDMVFSAAALDSVRRYAARVDAGGFGAYVAGAYDCFAPYNTTATASALPRYETAPDTTRARCAAGARAVADSLARRAAVAVPADELAWAARYAQVVRQWEEYASLLAHDVGAATRSRDAAMAENALWFERRAPAGMRLLLSAHNYHVARWNTTMGGAIAQALGGGWVPLAFDFDAGSFNAIAPSAPASFRAQTIPLTPAGSYEEGFRTAPHASFFVDLRSVSGDAKVAAWLMGPRTLRQIGAGFDPSRPANYDVAMNLPQPYDGVFFVRTSTPTTLLPFQP